MASSTILSAFLFLFLVLQTLEEGANGSFLDDGKTRMLIEKANEQGRPYLGLVIPNMFEMNPLLGHPSYKPSTLVIDYAGITTQLLLSAFDVYGVVHYGIAGNANPSLHIGDVAIPQYWSHLALWNWQKGTETTREKLDSSKLPNTPQTYVDQCNYQDNLLNNVWYQPEEIFPVDATPEERQHIFWVPVDSNYFQIAQSLEGLELEGCVNATKCLTHTPKVMRVEKGTSASIYLDNAAYRDFIYDKFNVSPVEMESAAVALVCYQQKVPYIVIRALSDLAGGGTAESNEADTFIDLAANNSVNVAVEFIKKVPLPSRSARVISST
nr:bark storage protein A-like [Ipomoea trifida]